MDNSESDSGEHGYAVSSTVSFILEAQPSCLGFADLEDLLVVGTYALEPWDQDGKEERAVETVGRDEPAAQKRTGSLLVFRIREQEATLLQTKAVPYALLDLQFSSNDSSIFAVATSVGLVSIFSIDFDKDGTLTLVRSIKVCDPSILVLSLAHHVSSHPNFSPLMAVSLSNGHIAIIDEERDAIEFSAHSQEAWTVSWSYPLPESQASQHLLYSGGDDSALCTFDTNFVSPDSTDEEIPRGEALNRDTKTHTAGVTAIVVLPTSQDAQRILITGSYDEHIRVLVPSVLPRAKAKVLAEKCLGGGVWRISSPFACNVSLDDGHISFNVLASCMHAGARVLTIERTQGVWSIKILASFTEHESMNYASGFQTNGDGLVFVSTSFYDRKLCVWNLNSVSNLSNRATQEYNSPHS